MREKAVQEKVEKMLKVKAKGTNIYRWYGQEYVMDNTVDIREAFQALMEHLGLEVELTSVKAKIVGK